MNTAQGLVAGQPPRGPPATSPNRLSKKEGPITSKFQVQQTILEIKASQMYEAPWIFSTTFNHLSVSM